MELKNKDIIVTVVTPTYNQGEFLDDTIKSVLCQTYKNIEYIIVDNESDDGTQEIINKYIGKFNIKYIREKDNGQSDAINKGFEMAKGDIVCWLNSDDMYYDHKVIEKVVSIFNRNKDIDILFGNGYIADRWGKIHKKYILNPDQLNGRYLNYMDPILQPSSFWKNNKIRLNLKYKYVLDWDYFRNYFTAGFKIGYVNEYFAIYRLYNESKTGKDDSARMKEIYGYVKRILNPFHPIVIAYYIEYILYKILQGKGVLNCKQNIKYLNQVFKGVLSHKLAEKSDVRIC